MTTAKKDQLLALGYMQAVEVSRKIGCHHSTVYRWLKAGKVSSESVGGTKWVLLSSLRRYLGKALYTKYGFPTPSED